MLPLRWWWRRSWGVLGSRDWSPIGGGRGLPLVAAGVGPGLRGGQRDDVGAVDFGEGGFALDAGDFAAHKLLGELLPEADALADLVGGAAVAVVAQF